jgi:hypothetical protein
MRATTWGEVKMSGRREIPVEPMPASRADFRQFAVMNGYTDQLATRAFGNVLFTKFWCDQEDSPYANLRAFRPIRQAERAMQFVEDLLTLCDDPYALYLCADAPTRQLLNRAVFTRFWIMDEGLYTAELSPEFAAIQEQMREFARSQAPSNGLAIDVPAPRSQADAADQKSAEDGPMYLRQAGKIDAAICSPLSTYLHKITKTTNPRRYRHDEGLNLVTLVGQVGLEPTT